MILVKYYILILSIYLILILNFTKSESSNKILFKILIILLNFSLIIFFNFNDFLLFFLIFEVSLILVIIIILIWGGQPERIKARLIIFFYTFISSLPLFFILIIIRFKFNSIYLFILEKNFINLNIINSIFLVLAFLIKLPIFRVHNWLPEAHVEAPVFGSIILAGVILKLGGVGLVIFSLIKLNDFIIIFLSLLSLFGGWFLSKTIIRFSDIKVIIAYSSVVHMCLIPFNSFLRTDIGLLGVIWMIVAHGLTSSCIFSVIDFFYNNSHSRRLFINKSLGRFNSFLVIVWILINIINFSGPITINLIREIFLILNLSMLTKINLILGGLITIFTLIYSIIIYSSVTQGVNSFFFSKFNQPNFKLINLWWLIIFPTPLLIFFAQL